MKILRAVSSAPPPLRCPDRALRSRDTVAARHRHPVRVYGAAGIGSHLWGRLLPSPLRSPQSYLRLPARLGSDARIEVRVFALQGARTGFNAWSSPAGRSGEGLGESETYGRSLTAATCDREANTPVCLCVSRHFLRSFEWAAGGLQQRPHW